MNPNLYSSVPRPFDAVAQILADLMEKRGFRVSRGTYHHGNGDTLPTWVITRPDYPEWQGLWQPWEMEPEYPEDAESQTLLEVCGTAIKTWDEVAWMYCDPNTPDESEAHCQRCGGCRMLPGTGPDDDLMNTPCPDCNEWAGKTRDLASAQSAQPASLAEELQAALETAKRDFSEAMQSEQSDQVCGFADGYKTAIQFAVNAMCRHHQRERLRSFVWDVAIGSIQADDARRMATRLLNELRDAEAKEATP